jgi:hypothetical protein
LLPLDFGGRDYLQEAIEVAQIQQEFDIIEEAIEVAQIQQEFDIIEELKRILSSAPVLAAPRSRKPMLLYIAATNRVVSAVVAVERPKEGKAHGVQRPIYYISEVLTDSKQR